MNIKILSPTPYRVFQRAKKAEIAIVSDVKLLWADLDVADNSHTDIYSAKLDFEDCGGGVYKSYASLPEGGWFNLTLKIRTEEGICDVLISPVGCGEVFVIAGQSHATNSNNKQFRVTEPQGRITVYEPDTGLWRTAHDPQPCYDRSDYNARFGSIWPCTFDALYKKISVPIGMTNAAYGATALFQWQPGEIHFQHLVDCCRAAKDFRAILWQQGESDVMWHTETDAYVNGMLALKAALDAELSIDTKWLIAKSTIHSSVYDDKVNEEKIRRAYDILLTHEGFYPGPDTDTLNGDNRDKGEISGHLTEKGQIAAGELWSQAIYAFINQHTGL